MKDYTLIANNKNKTKITFAYDHGLPYKPNIRPTLEYGDWDGHPNQALIKITFDDKDMSLFDNKKEIIINEIYLIQDEYWIDLNDVYLIISRNDYLTNKIDNNNITFVFLFKNEIINGISLNEE